jgi:hypothetical protein
MNSLASVREIQRGKRRTEATEGVRSIAPVGASIAAKAPIRRPVWLPFLARYAVRRSANEKVLVQQAEGGLPCGQDQGSSLLGAS